MLKEICSIATGNAANSLSTMSERRVDISLPNVMVESLDKVADIFGKREKDVSAVSFSVSGEISGSMALVFSYSQSVKIANILTKRNTSQDKNLDEMGQSALMELGNIVAGSYVRVLADGLKMRITYSIPGFDHDMIGVILDEIVVRLPTEVESAIVMESEFIIKEETFLGQLIFILEPSSLNSVVKALGSRDEQGQSRE
ncbi:MAG: chemotaxis protein CheC [Candidatus Neomarinimicrobiota bacterium]